jgi:hypothetical protein
MLETKEVKSSSIPVPDVEEHKAANISVPDVEEHKVERPWQGTLLFVLNIIFLIGIAFTILSLFLAGVFGILTYNNNYPVLLGVLVGLSLLVFLLALVSFFILEIFVTIGLFKGKKWAIITMLIFASFDLMVTVFTFNLLSFIILVIFFYLEITCLAHPFYKSKKYIKNTLDTNK